MTHIARQALGPLARLAVFADGEGLAASTEVWLSREVIERFTRLGYPGASAATRGNYRSWLLRLREAVIGPELASGPAAKLSGSNASRAYTRAEQAALWSWAAGQPTNALRDGCRLLLALGLGAGLESAEILTLRTHDVTVHSNGAVVVAVRSRLARRVVCRRPVENTLAELAELAAAATSRPCYLFRPHAHARDKNTVGNFVARTHKVPGCPPLIQARARSTWLIDLINAQLPLPVLVAAAGVETLHALSRFLPYATPTSADAAAQFLRGPR